MNPLYEILFSDGEFFLGGNLQTTRWVEIPLKPIERFTYYVPNTNKVIIENFYSAMKNNQIGCHITSRIPTERNRIRWDLIVSGLSRTKKVCDLLVDKSRIKNKQIELMLAYLNERLLDPKSINTTGYNVKMAIQSSRQ